MYDYNLNDFTKGMIVNCGGMIGKVIKQTVYGVNVSLQSDPNGIFKKGQRLYFPACDTEIISK